MCSHLSELQHILINNKKYISDRRIVLFKVKIMVCRCNFLLIMLVSINCKQFGSESDNQWSGIFNKHVRRLMKYNDYDPQCNLNFLDV